jgi:aspartate/methionine/tyrosine aminotransferase
VPSWNLFVPTEQEYVVNSNDSCPLAFDILKWAQVGVTPGIGFGGHSEGYLCLSYANSIENIAEGLDRLERYLAGL